MFLITFNFDQFLTVFDNLDTTTAMSTGPIKCINFKDLILLVSFLTFNKLPANRHLKILF